MAWRFLAFGLLVLNIMLFAARAMAPPEPVRERVLPPLPDAPRLMLVDEVEVSTNVVDGEQCFTIGPLATVLQMRRAEDRLRPFASHMRSRETSADRDRGWWVYLPPLSNRQDALSLARQLADAGVEDYYVVTSGEMENTVSLGLYEHQDNARSRQNRIRNLGFDAQMSVRREEAPQYWVDYRLPEGERSPWRFILRASPGARHFDIPCFDSDPGTTEPY